ncbi:MAG: right-handed parallel beta-helix repeat-containing protein [Paludibacter sp.]|nr:right-handed parallel beta-helix repeat-containing protein [Paludibacter sp.]
MKKINLSIAVVLISILLSNIYAVDYYVTTSGLVSNDGLSWANAMTLNAALAVAQDDDVIHIGAGTFVPADYITGGTLEEDKTFEIKSNVALIGGYPANPISGDNPSDDHVTIFNGNETYYHVVAVTAPAASGKKISIDNVTITGGNAAASGAATLTINALSFVRINGSAMIIGGAVVEINNSKIINNKSRSHTPGVYAFSNADVTVNNCLVENNVGQSTAGNGASFWFASSTLRVNNSSIIGNKNSGVGAIQIITNSKGYFYNTTISQNVAGLGSATTSRNGSGIYVRDGSQVQVVNCTIYGNESNGNGAGIALHTSNVTTLPNTLEVISSTITGNKSLLLNPSTAGIFALTAGCTINIHNSIVSGNTALGANNHDAAVTSTSVLTPKKSTIGVKMYDGDAVEVADKSFIAATMLDALANNGGATQTCKLLLDEETNTAFTMGMTSAALQSLGGILTPAVPDNIVMYDQLGNQRAGTVMGAWIANGPFSNTIQVSEKQQPVAYADQNGIVVHTKTSDRVVVFNITGQRVFDTTAKGDVTRIDNQLRKGNVYIVNVNGQNSKVLF